MGKSTEYYNSNPKAKAKKNAYNAEYQKKPSAVRKRVEANRANRKAQKNGTAKVGDKKDASHTKRGIVMKPQSVNRGSSSDSPGDVRSRGERSL
jgi:excinuclease UvrABC helicase subunit UvrB